MVEDTTMMDKQVEVDLIDAQIEAAKERWRERAAVGAMLELIRSDYEEHRQPETLIEASKYLERFTNGRYPRVWTPLADDVLLVDTADGESLRVESLSRGTREQLFLSVRMALVAMYARRGVLLPMILDDVLVNFDDGRARIAAGVLTEFAAEGHQVLLFTCHEHVRSMFNELNADVRRLPSRYEEEVLEEVIVEEEPVVEIIEPEPVEEVFEEAVVVKKKPKPRPTFVDAEYLPLEPMTETRRHVEEITEVIAAEAKIESPTPVPESVRVTIEPPVLGEPEPTPLAAEIAYGEATAEYDGELAYGTPGSLEPVAAETYRNESAYVRAYETSPSGEIDYGSLGQEIAYEAGDETFGDGESWLTEAQEVWAEPTDVVT